MKISNVFSRKNRILLRELVVTDFKLRYQGSILGYVWSLLKPLLLFTILYIVFVKFLRFDRGSGVDHFSVYLLLGVVIWSFFTEATSQGMVAIVGRGDLIRKINFPKYIIVISGTLSALINFFLNLIVVSVFMLINGVELQASVLLLPLNILELYVFSLAIAFLLSALFVKYRDISHIWEVFLQGAFYATPILYSMSMVMDQSMVAAKLLLLNPIAQIIQDSRFNMISHKTVTTSGLINNVFIELIPFVIVLLTVAIAVWYFKKTQKYFAENV